MGVQRSPLAALFAVFGILSGTQTLLKAAPPRNKKDPAVEYYFGALILIVAGILIRVCGADIIDFRLSRAAQALRPFIAQYTRNLAVPLMRRYPSLDNARK